MNRRAAILFGGWLLMWPPLVEDREHRPLSEWKQVAAFDTAAACEADRERGFRKKQAWADGARCVPASAVVPQPARQK